MAAAHCAITDSPPLGPTCWIHERIQFGRPIGGFQLVQDLLARMLGSVTSCQAMMLRRGQLQDQGLMEDEHASLAKAFTPVKCHETVGYPRELLGGNGPAREPGRSLRCRRRSYL